MRYVFYSSLYFNILIILVVALQSLSLHIGMFYLQVEYYVVNKFCIYYLNLFMVIMEFIKFKMGI